ncbi:MAG TPA: hypothetical protein VFS28_01985, partial [Gemmatimonadales bacterium]|nr:hypothetical protein [Gemmatimonadales bacterium]
DNRDGLLRTGMNTEVEIHIGQRDSALAVSNAALRTDRDYVSAADVLGLDLATVNKQLAQADSAAAAAPAGDSSRQSTLGANGKPAEGAAAGTMTMPNGSVIKLPDGVTAAQVTAAFQHMRQAFQGGGAPSAEDRALLQKVRAANPDMMGGGRRGGPGGGANGGSSLNARFGGNYIVFVKHGDQIRPARVRTGLTDLEYSEVVSGLQEGDSVLILPSASLVQSQQDFKERINRFTGGGGVPGMKANTSTAKRGQ